MKETRLRWFDHVRRVEEMEQIVNKIGRGRPKKTWEETLKFDMKYIGLTADMPRGRNAWKLRIHVLNPT